LLLENVRVRQPTQLTQSQLWKSPLVFLNQSLSLVSNVVLRDGFAALRVIVNTVVRVLNPEDLVDFAQNGSEELLGVRESSLEHVRSLS
jgi:hypothetical protein